MLLAEGEVAYFGPAADAVHCDFFSFFLFFFFFLRLSMFPFSDFEKAGYKCPRYTNPADFFLDVTAINTHSEKSLLFFFLNCFFVKLC